MARGRKDEKGGGKIGAMVAVCVGLALVGIGVFMILSFVTADVYLDPEEAAKKCWTGLLGAWTAFGSIHTVGKIPSLAMAVMIVFWGLNTARHMRFLATWPHVVGGGLVVCALSMGLCSLADLYDMDTGGLFAVYLSPPAILYFGRWGLALASSILMFLGILLAFGETAVISIRTALATIRDFVFGTAGMALRMGELLKMLFSPRLAVAGGVAEDRAAGKRRPERQTRAADSSGPAAPPSSPAVADKEDAAEEDSVEAEKKPSQDHLRVWHPREAFASRFLSIDLRNDPPAPPVEEVVAGIASDEKEGADGEPGTPAADVIMDVDAEAEESDQLEVRVTEEQARADVEALARAALEPDPEAEDEVEVVVEQQTARGGIVDATPDPEPVAQRPAKPAPPPPRPQPARPAVQPAKDAEKGLDDYELPPLELLDPPSPPAVEDRSHLERCAKILEQTLAEFKIEGRVVHIEQGPRVTMYELSLAPGIRLSKVTSLADNLAMQLKAESVRIIAPIPGKDTIGIEIPNTVKELVSLSDIVKAVNREKRRQALPICLGKDVSGSSLVADLTKMPHLLIAGATGSGKSVCINSIIMSILMCCRPDEAQLIMIDPKVVELSRFKDIPHLMSPVITDMKRAVSVLEWICQKMDERYEQMSQVSVNNIAKFNSLGEEEIRERLDAYSSLEEIEAFPKSMPYMVVIIDELADLMMVAGKEVEQHITRLAAKSRAVGIHLILATQRPSVDVITGLIKANMPCRIAFQVASRVDSRTILDQNGAEALLGQGDMLYLPPGVGKLTRAQGVFVSDEELFRVVDRTKEMADPQYHGDLLGPVIGGGSGDVDVSSFDELFLEAGEAIIESQRGSVSLLQRKFGIGYGRAARIIDQLASAGLLGPFRDGKAREILLTMEEFDAKFRGGAESSDWDDDDEGSLAGLRDDEMGPGEDPWE